MSNNKPYPEQPHLHTKAPHRAALLTYPGNFREALRQAQEDPKKTLLGVAQGIPSVFVTKVCFHGIYCHKTPWPEPDTGIDSCINKTRLHLDGR